MTQSVVAVIVIIALLACCCVLVTVGVGAWAAYRVTQATELAPLLTEVFATQTPTPKPDIVLTPLPSPLPGAGDTLETLNAAVIPPSDLREIAIRIKGIPDIPETVSDTPANHDLGETLTFNVTNTDTNENFNIKATLIYKSENVYFFSEEGIEANKGQVQELVDNFQNKTYSTDREFFGSEWTPGVDGDPHLYILYVHGLGSSVAGYYSSSDEYSRLAHPYSNEKEMFYINADTTGPSDPSLPGTLAHEFQHMIHWYHDRNEETWMNEGSSVLAEFLNGYSADGFDSDFISQPDLQLNAWTEGGAGSDSIPHYGAGFLFMDYFLDRFGNDATQALVADPANGLHAVDDVLRSQAITDPTTKQPITALDVVADWVIANYLGDPDVADGRYTYHNYSGAPKVSSPTDRFDNCPVAQNATVHQFAADYYEINCSGAVTLTFTGSRQVPVIPTKPHSDRYAFWGHRNDESDTYLTHAFDLTTLKTATLHYWTWWAIEQDYDFAYLEVSTDGGKTWKIINTPSGASANPTGNNLGWGYTGNSGGGTDSAWVEEVVDLSEYAGQKIQVRFEYVTDAAVNRAGFMVDDISIPEINYSTDFEDDAGDWEGTGFVRMDNLLPQTFIVQIIHQDGETTVERMPLDAENTGSLKFNLDSGEKATLVVLGTTPFTTEVASYQFEVK
jgi:immune inhibitor A